MRIFWKLNFVPRARRSKAIKIFYSMQDGDTLWVAVSNFYDVFAAHQQVYDTCVIELGYPIFANADMARLARFELCRLLFLGISQRWKGSLS